MKIPILLIEATIGSRPKLFRQIGIVVLVLVTSLLVLFVTLKPAQASSAPASFVTQWSFSDPNDVQGFTPSGVATDSSGNVYVSDFGNHGIRKFDSDGQFLTKWGSQGSDNGQLQYPSDLAIDSSDNVYVVNYGSNNVQKFDSDGNFLTKWGSYGSDNGQFIDPWSIATDSSGNVYVTDPTNHRVQKFDSDGNFLTKWGSQGSADGQFGYAYMLATDSSGNVYVTDAVDYRIQKFDSSGNFLSKWGGQGSADGQFSALPRGIAIGSSGIVYVADDTHSIKQFDTSGNFLTKWGSQGSAEGQFFYPIDIAADSSDSIYVADQGNHRIQKFGPSTAIDSASQNVSAGGTVTTVGSSGTATQDDPIGTSVTSPVSGPVSINEAADSQTAPSGYAFFGQQVTIEAPNASVANPLKITLVLDSSVIPSGHDSNTVQMFRDGTPIADCIDTSGTATPDPCISKREALGEGDVQITVLSSHASIWNAGVVNKYDYTGFLSPVDNPNVYNKAKAGSAIPVKFKLGGDKGLDVFYTEKKADGTTVRYPKSATMACDSTASVDAIEQTVTAGSSSLAYDPSTQQYSYTWKTDKGWAGTCRQLVVKFKDGTEHRAFFKLTKQ